MRYRIPAAYRQPIWGGVDPRLKRSLAMSSAVAAVVLAVVFLSPPRKDRDRTVEDVPERFARLILAEKKPAPPTPPAPAQMRAPVIPEPIPEEKNPEPAKAEPRNADLKPTAPPQAKEVGRRREKATSPEAKGQAGRVRARGCLRRCPQGA